jgi:hypothetical protein
MADAVQYLRLIVTAPGAFGSSELASSIGATLQAFHDNIPSRSAAIVGWYSDCLGSGLPFHVPFSFEHDAANEFKWQLEAAGCTVRLTDAGS